MRKLEIGPGLNEGVREPGWDTLTADTNTTATYHGWWGYERLPVADEAYDLVYASHVIEHIPWYKVSDALAELHRIIAAGGQAEIWTVDFAKVVAAYQSGRIPDNWRRCNKQNSLMAWVNGRIFAYNRTQESGEGLNFHRSCFDRPYLKQLLQQAGFSRTDDLSKPRGADHGFINMGVCAWKD